MGHEFNEGAALNTSRSAVRPAAVAGSFYPRDPEELSATVAALLAGQHGPARPPKALIVPHAGYVYSGNVAAQAYASLGSAARALRRVLLLGPSHREWFRGLAVPTAQAFATPLGQVRVDTAAVSRLCALPAVVRSDAAHALEHSLEVQLPFLQHLAPAAEIVPVVAGDASAAEVAAVIEELWDGAETLIVVSSDLSHYHSYRTARVLDARDRAGDRWGPLGSLGRAGLRLRACQWTYPGSARSWAARCSTRPAKFGRHGGRQTARGGLWCIWVLRTLRVVPGPGRPDCRLQALP